jgi:hypothetical protein
MYPAAAARWRAGRDAPDFGSTRKLRVRRLRKKTLDRFSAEFLGMLFVMKPDVAFNSVDICALGAKAVVLHPDAIVYLIEQFWFCCGGAFVGNFRGC